jgi:hypothetical protein
MHTHCHVDHQGCLELDNRLCGLTQGLSYVLGREFLYQFNVVLGDEEAASINLGSKPILLHQIKDID